ncbi:MAG: PfkB family carbohydrate kinase [Bacteroidota bacterium]
MSLLIVGSMAFDAIETPFGKTDKIIGGAGTYICYSASYFVDQSYAVSVVGGDFPKATLKDLNDRGVNTDGVEVKENEQSFFWSGKYHNDMNSRDTLVTELNVLEHFEPKVPDAARTTDYVMLGNLSPDVQRDVINQMSERPKLIALDTMNFWMDIALDSLKETLKLIDLLIINDEEARQLSGEYSLLKAAQAIRKMGPKYLIIKKGEHGALLFFEDKVFFAPALPLEEVFDPTGAGDVFAGGVMGYLAKADDLSFAAFKRSIIYGSAMASFCVEKFGTENLEKLSDEAIQTRATAFLNLVQVEFDALTSL